jgi:hypothetical protein
MGATAFLMLLYIDDDSVDRVLIRRLRESGYDTVTPTDAGTSGQADPVHFMSAIRAGRAVLTHNYDDFKLLHDLILLAGGHHPGALVVRRDNDPTRDMASRTIVRANR